MKTCEACGCIFPNENHGINPDAPAFPQSERPFIEHIASHLEPGQKVICKICGKTAEEIIGRPSP